MTLSSTTLLLFLLFIAAVMMFIPIIPVIMAIRDKKDVKPLSVNLEYSKDPRAIAKYFNQYFLESFNEKKLKENTTLESMKLGKLEVISDTFSKPVYDNMVYVLNEAVVPKGIVCKREIIARDNLTLLDNCTIRVIKAEKKLTIGKNCCVQRWIDVEGSMTIGENSNINISSCSSVMHLSKGVIFNRLFANPILSASTFKFQHNFKLHEEMLVKKSAIEDNLLYIQDKSHSIAENKIIFNSIVTQGTLLVDKHVKIYGSIKANKNVKIANNCFVLGNIISEGNISIGENCFIMGNLFSRNKISIGKYSQIGTSEHTKSVVAKKEISLAEHVTVFNYILTDKQGEVI